MALDRTLAHGLIVATIGAGLTVRAVLHRPARPGGDRSIATLWAVMIVTPLLACLTPALAFADYRFSRFVAIVGAASCLACGSLYLRAHLDRARQSSHERWTANGTYARVRHPIDAALWIWTFAQALLVANWIAGPAPLVAFAVLHVVRVRREEASMLARFGIAYRDYMSRTDRLLPGVW